MPLVTSEAVERCVIGFVPVVQAFETGFLLADEPSTGLEACLRRPSVDFPAVFGLNCCLLLPLAPLAFDFDVLVALPAIAAVPFMLAATDCVRSETAERSRELRQRGDNSYLL